MKQKISIISVILVIASLSLAACGGITLPGQVREEQKAPVAALPQQSQPSTNSGLDTSLSGYETALENIYTQVNPSVVSIRVVQKQNVSINSTDQTLPFFNMPGFPNFFGAPDQNNPQTAPQ